VPTSISEPARETPVLTETDVLVVGGGSAGVAAAVSAARSGARVVLAERYGSLGGLATGGLIALLLTLDDGRGRQVIGGLCQEVTERLTGAGGAFHPPREEWGSTDRERIEHYWRSGLVWGGKRGVRYSVAYDPEVLRQVLNDLVREAGVDLILHLWGADALVEDGRLRGVSFQSKAGRQAILADVVIDTTGDGDVFTSAGCAFESERVHPWLWFRMAGVEDVEAAIDHGGWFFRTPNAGQLLLPWGAAARIERKIDATDPRDLTFAEVECRRLVMEEVERLRAEVPGMSAAHLCGIATQLGITESRRLVGRHVLSRAEMNQPCDDVIAVTGHWTRYGDVYAVPYRSLQPTELTNMLVAGRHISADHPTHNATKEIPACFATGQAAGTAAAIALGCGGNVGDVDVSQLQSALTNAGALLDYPFERSA